jgi:hypothetical protein
MKKNSNNIESKLIKESPEEWNFFIKELIGKSYVKLLNSGYTKEELNKFFNQNKINVDIINGQYVIYCGKEVIFKSQRNISAYKFIKDGEEIMYDWCVSKMGRKFEPIDTTVLDRTIPENKKYISSEKSKLKDFITETVKSIITEASNSQIKKKVINQLYKHTKQFTTHLYKDDNWAAVSQAFKTIEAVIGDSGELEVRVENGGYWKQIGEFPNYKEYKFTIILNNGIEIGGSLKCHAAGTMEDVFEKYDMTITFW